MMKDLKGRRLQPGEGTQHNRNKTVSNERRDIEHPTEFHRRERTMNPFARAKDTATLYRVVKTEHRQAKESSTDKLGCESCGRVVTHLVVGSMMCEMWRAYISGSGIEN